MGRIAIIAFFAVFYISSGAQNGFEFETSRKRIAIPFQLVNNLIFIPINVNGVALNFLVDTGVEETILLSLENKEINLRNVQKIRLKGLGSEEAIDGLKSTANILSVNGFTDKNHTLYIVTDESFNFSPQVGIPVNGIIGYHFFKDHIVDINYSRRKIFVYSDENKIRNKVSRRFAAVPITIEKNKPYALANVLIDKKQQDLKLLVDLGNSDALWLFAKDYSGIRIPPKNFNDYLGKGFSGEIFGKRARIGQFTLGNFVFDLPIAAFPDSKSTQSVNMVKERSGSLGGEIFRRFHVVFDYPGSKIYLKSNNNSSDPFHYNMSGIELQNDGLQWVQETVALETAFENNTFDENGNKEKFRYKFSLKPVYVITNVRDKSPAEACGLKKGDTVTTINGVQAHRYSLEKINEMLKSEVGKWLNFEVERNGIPLKFRFQLIDIL